MLPIPTNQGIGALQLPALPPTPSGPHPTAPGSFGNLFDQMHTAAEQQQAQHANALPQLPTAMEVRPIMPSMSLDQPWQDSVEFPDAVNSDGLKLPGQQKTRPVTPTGKSEAVNPSTFLDPLKHAFQEANQLQTKSEDLANEAAIGGDVDLHDVMISGEKANVALQLTLQIRNRLVDAYQEVMRMQV